MVRPYSLDLRERVVTAVESGQTCRAVAELFDVSVASVVKWSQRARATGSAAAKPILDCSHRKGIVLDAFAGSGTTLVAAHKTGRRGYGIELDPLYCDVILQRLGTIAKVEPMVARSME